MLFLSCKANARVYLVKTGPPSHCSLLVNCVVLYLVLILLFYVLCLSNVLFYVFSLCKCELYYCHRVSTQMQLNISYCSAVCDEKMGCTSLYLCINTM